MSVPPVPGDVPPAEPFDSPVTRPMPVQLRPPTGKRGGGASLTATTVKGFTWIFTGAMSQVLLQLVSMVVLGRLLSPKEFGAAGAAALIISLSQVMSQLGVGPALVQRKHLTDREISAAFHTSVLLSLVLAASLFVASPWLNPLVRLPRDSNLLPTLTIALALAGAAATPLGLLQRELRFRELATVDVLALGPATIGTSVVLAALDFGAISIIFGQIAGAAVTFAGYTYLARPPLRPATPAATWRAAKPLLAFGAWYSLSQIGNWFALNADNFVTTRVLGVEAYGLYARAYNLLAQPAHAIGTAVDKALFPAMAKVKDDGERLRTAYVASASLIALITVPGSVLLFVLAPEIIGILLGAQWTAVVVPLQIFAVVLMPRASYKISGSLTRATGAVSGGAWRQWLYAAEVFVGCWVGARWGLKGVAAGASIAIVAHFLVMLQFSGRVAPGLISGVLLMYLKHLPVAVVSLVAAQGVALAVRPIGVMPLTVVVVGLVWAVATAGTLLLMRRFFVEELSVVKSVRGSRGAVAK